MAGRRARREGPQRRVSAHGGGRDCRGCASHSARRDARAIRARSDEDVCLHCHNGSISTFNIAADIRKRSGHYVPFREGVHDPAEIPFTMRRHVECVDCHNPHAAAPNPVGAVRGTLGQTVKVPNLHVTGVTISGRQTDDSRFLYEICFKCHGDSTRRGRQTRRQISQTNTRLEFQTSNPSFHPVAGPRRNSDVVSLIPPLRVGSVITCTDCHNSDNARFAGGSGANGPHGSIYEPLPVRQFDTDDFPPARAQAYSLCYVCP